MSRGDVARANACAATTAAANPLINEFLRILAPHDESDVEFVCPAGPQARRVAGVSDDICPEVRFFCHRTVLRRRCALFADEAEFESLSSAPAATRRLVLPLPAEDDVAFEVLRFVYCGSVFFSPFFRERFAQFLAVVDYLGVDQLQNSPAVHGQPTVSCSALFSETGVERWLQDLSSEQLVQLMQIGSPTQGTGAVGFSVRQALLTKLLQLRPEDFTIDALGRDLHCRLLNFGLPVGEEVEPPRQLVPRPADQRAPGEVTDSVSAPSPDQPAPRPQNPPSGSRPSGAMGGGGGVAAAVAAIAATPPPRTAALTDHEKEGIQAKIDNLDNDQLDRALDMLRAEGVIAGDDDDAELDIEAMPPHKLRHFLDFLNAETNRATRRRMGH